MRRITRIEPVTGQGRTPEQSPVEGEIATGIGMEGADLAPSQAESAPGRFRANVLANLGYFLLNVAVGLWFTRYLIIKLGVSAYGLIPLATSITAYISVLTVALSGSVGRFVTMSLARGDDAGANRSFNTSLFGSLAASIALLPLLAPLALAAPLILNVPAGQGNGARWLLMGTFTAFLVTAVGSNFAVATFARSRFDIRSLIDSVSLLVRVGGVVAFFSWLAPQLSQVGAAVFGSSLVWLACTAWAWRKLTPGLRIRRSDFQRSQLRALGSTGGWLVMNQAASVLFLQIDLLLVNIVVGADAAGSYAPVLQLSRMLRMLAGVIAAVLAPTILSRHARRDTGGLVRISQQSVKLLGLSMALPIGLLCGLARPFLETWLGYPFGRLAPLMWLLVAPLCINLAVMPLFSVQLALNKVRSPGLVSVAMGAANLALALALAAPLGWGMYGVAAAGAIMLTLKNVVYTPLYSASIVGRSLGTFYGALMPSVLAALAVAAASGRLAAAVDLTSWPRLACTGVAMTIPYLLLAFLSLRADERRTVRNILFQRAGPRA